jgi:hypothetical protein
LGRADANALAGCDAGSIGDVVAANRRAVVADLLHHVTARTTRLSSMTKMMKYFNYLLAGAP